MQPFHLNNHHISRGRQGPRGCQVPSLTPCDTLHPDGPHISMGRQVPFLTSRDTFRPDSCHVLRGCHLWVVRYLHWHRATHSALTIVTYQWIVRDQGVVKVWPLLVGPAYYAPVGMNFLFDSLEVSRNQCSSYGCICTWWMVMSYPLYSYRRMDGHTDGLVIGSHKPLRILHSCILIRKELAHHVQIPYSMLMSSIYGKKSLRSWDLNSKSSQQEKTLHSRDLG